MNLKKISLKVIILAVLMIVIAGVFQKVNAETDLTPPVYFGIRNLRDSKWGYAIGNPMDNEEKGNSANIWDIQKFESLNSAGVNVNAYCIKAGVGFANTSERKQYTVSYDFKKEKDKIIALLKDDTLNKYYNHILAMADLFYLKDVSTEDEKQELLHNAGCYKELEELEDLEDFGEYMITDDEIEAIQQAALWYYTNNDEDKYNKIGDNNTWFTYTTNESDYNALMNYKRFEGGIGPLRASQAISLYNYLIEQAAQKAKDYENATAKSRTKITLYTSRENLAKTQPVIIIEREKGEFDLALRKYITKVTTNGSTVELKGDTLREPDIDEALLAEGKGETTATYKHRKDPVEVKTGSVVTYKITIYNEGEVSGRAEQVIDQLPDGLEFDDKIISGNFTKESYDTTSNRIVFKRIEGNQSNLSAYSGSGDLSSETIEFQCRVTKEPIEQGEIVLTNVAWISKEYNAEEKITITNESKLDRDSTPGIIPKINDSDVNKDNMQDYKGNSQNDNVTPGNSSYFYKGQEDDDDFEKLVLPKKITGTYNLKIVKVDSTNIGKKLNGAVFTVNDTERYQTEINGEVIVKSNKKIETSEQTDRYTIVEETAPAGYNKFEGTINLEVKTKQQNGQYIIDKDHTTMNVTGNNSGDVQLEMDEGTGQITITVKDTPITGKYSLKIVKVDSTNENNKLSGAVFTVNDKERNQTGTDGEIIIEKDKEITKEDETATYTIKEETAPAGYNKFGGTINLEVKTKEQNGKYIIDTDQTKIKVTDGNTEDAKLEMDEETGQITIKVKDTPITGKYSLKIVKVDSTNENNKLKGEYLQ